MNAGWAILALFMGVGAYLVTWVGHRMLKARVGQRLAFDRWKYRVEERAVALIQAQMEVAALKQEFAGLIDEVPEGFEGHVLEVAKFGYAWERMVLREAEARGLYHPVAPFAAPPPQPVVETVGVEMPQTPQLPKTSGPSMEWVGGRFVPR